MQIKNGTITKYPLIYLVLIVLLISVSSATAYSEVIDPSNPILSDKFKRTTITPVMDTKIEKEKNLVFCSTLQMAWNKICKDIAEGPLNVIAPPWYVAPLNKLMDQPALLSEEAYFSMAGFKKDNILEKINEGLKEKFKQLSKDELVTLKVNLIYPYDILSFAYLYKNLEFAIPFEKMNPFKIEKDNDIINVKTFGFEQDRDKNNIEYIRKLINQLKLLCYSRDEGFIIELKTKSETDELIISTFKPEQTLNGTYKKINDRIEGNKKSKLEICMASDEDIMKITEFGTGLLKNEELKSVSLSSSEKDAKIYAIKSLKIPCIKFNILHSYKEILEKKIVFSKYPISKFREVIQKIDFSLNEKGSKLVSYALIHTMGCMPLPQVIDLHVTPPFVVLLKSRDKPSPYFIAYIANEELLETINSDLFPVHTKNGIEYTDEVSLADAIRQRASLKFIKKKLDSMTDTKEINAIKNNGSLVESAILYDNPQAMKLLIKSGADVSKNGNNLVFKLIEEFSRFYFFNLNPNKSEDYLVDEKHKKNILEKIKVLLKCKIDNMKTSEIMIACLSFYDSKSSSSIELVDLINMLINSGADVNYKIFSGETPLILAIQKKMSIEFIKKLIEKGADVKATDKNGHDALYYAKENKMGDVVKLLDVK